jgi:hypothetical protein
MQGPSASAMAAGEPPALGAATDAAASTTDGGLAFGLESLPPWVPAAFCFGFALGFGPLPALLATAALLASVAVGSALGLGSHVSAGARIGFPGAGTAARDALGLR